ncbi:unnamed protein product [Vicia faba]|uniref:Reverse transcriptase Ty1/copia-type domain-containing protein n=1 Tax=Vicia faba TaxID=3906 RepID=A0AAV0Z7J9_VICFA|nr:unnamed protein product [Vicia faba]
MKRCQSDHTIFFNKNNCENILLVVYVNDIVITKSDSKGINKLKAFLQTKFQTKDLGVLKYFLGIEVTKEIFLSQGKCVLDLLSETDMMRSKTCETPMKPEVKLTVDVAFFFGSTKV